MRTLDKDFEDKFANEFKFVIDFVRNNNDVFWGIRNNLVDLYVNGGQFFSIEKTSKGYKGYFNIKGYGDYLPNNNVRALVSSVSKKLLDDTNIKTWNSILKDLKNTVKEYMESHKKRNGDSETSREKILQQKLALKFNNSDSEYYTYDIEYNVESLNDYYFLLDGKKPDYNLKDKKGNVKTQTLGRVDNMVIEIKENKIYFILMEVKEGTNAIKVTGKNTKFYGDGIIGHVNLYMQIIDYVRNDKKYFSKYREDKGLKPFEIDIKENLLNEVKYIMKFYQKYDLINNKKFKNYDYDKLEYGDIELVFYLGNYTKGRKLENHLGLNGKQADSVINLINRKYSEMKYDYIDKKQICNFKYYKSTKAYYEEITDKDVDIKSYNQIKVKDNNGEVEFYEEKK